MRHLLRPLVRAVLNPISIPPRRVLSVPLCTSSPRPVPKPHFIPPEMTDNIVNFYAGQPPLNRLSFQRQHAGKLNAYLHNPSTKFIVFNLGRVFVPKGQFDRPYYLSLPQVSSLVGDGFEDPEKDSANFKARQAARPVGSAPLVFLGLDERGHESDDLENPTGTPYFAIDASGTTFGDVSKAEGKSGEEAKVDGDWGDARASGGAMSAYDAGVFASARALTDWNGRNRHCAACGAKTYSLWGGWKRACTTALDDAKRCFSNAGLHNFCYPRTDPVTIMGILDPTGDRMLLGRQKAWPKGFYSCLAGFIEPGESFEDAVRRETLEEAGVTVGPVRYSSSQPWPFPANIMVGCYGRATSDVIRLDLDNELEDAQWFPRSVVAALFDKEGATHFSRKDYQQIDKALTEQDSEACKIHGDLASRLTKIPPETAIAGKLIRQWALGPHAVDLVSRL